jgi:hypothetical protein
MHDSSILDQTRGK